MSFRVLEDGDAVCLSCGTRLEGGEGTPLADAIGAHDVFCASMRERQAADAGEADPERGEAQRGAGRTWPRRPLPGLPPEALTMRQVAQRLGMRPRRVRELIARGEIASVRAGLSERVFLEELEAYERARREGS